MQISLKNCTDRHQETKGKINLVTLVLSVMGGKASDVVGKTLVKSRKEQEETKESPKVEKSPSSPLHSLYQSFPSMPLMMPYQHQGYNYGHMPNPVYQGYRPRQRGRFTQGGSKPIGPCLFCESMGHLIKDCLKFKAMKQNKQFEWTHKYLFRVNSYYHSSYHVCDKCNNTVIAYMFSRHNCRWLYFVQ